ncbi:MAG: protein-glutamate O-methyltransferase CheR [Candidatus Eisenbacteria bacterium]|uniref:protein-glutamate O-methyltransferase n=1 Tax=Eiseniibacteriota bacterium TaxID=2212470 RepID=A0A956NIE0_UNCEI|nr:protein-glutamate O-methyltransferase CheR [Candidatus Eisenbacteria bacterium]MCB9465660.1 protein-glutamate O-methyltransferase CheR [Candidatus Eisenbacteria bacterium]
MSSPTMSIAQFERLRKLIYEKSGIWFADNKKYLLEARLGRRLLELEIDDFDQYVSFMTMGPYRDDEFNEMFSRITINETSFFRNGPQLDVFEKKILPEIVEKRKNMRQLRIWSAACSTGEEPYTLGIIASRVLGFRAKEWTVQIFGSDISERAIRIARAGRYPSLSLRSVPPAIVQKYFHEANGFNQIDPEIQAMVTFGRLNLKDRLAARRYGVWDVIFCRNVMIYFDQDMKDQSLELFASVLAPDGALLVGHSESFRNNAHFVARSEPQGFAYARVQGSGGVLRNAA